MYLRVLRRANALGAGLPAGSHAADYVIASCPLLIYHTTPSSKKSSSIALDFSAFPK